MAANQACRRVVLGSALWFVACAGSELPPSVWPPPNFELVVEEVEPDGARMHVLRRFAVDASGTVVYGTSARPLVDEATGTSLPVFDRLAIYRLEPLCVRSLARKIDRLGIGELDLSPVVAGDAVGPGLVLTWHAFDQHRRLVSQGRLRGPMAEIIGVVAAHLPSGESFATPLQKPVVPVLRGVPAPGEGAATSLAAYRSVLAERPDDPQRVLIAFALACRAGLRGEAEELLARWRRLDEVEREQGFRDELGGPRLNAALLQSFVDHG